MARKKKIETEPSIEATKDVNVAEVTEPKVEVAKEEVNTVSEAKERNQRKADIPNSYEIPVRSNVSGGLTYVSRKNKGLEFHWDHTGDVEYIEYSELISMRNTQRKFFENNWIVIEDSDYTADEVYRALSVQKFYEFGLNSIDDVFTLSEDSLKELAAKASKGLKDNIILRARSLYNDGSDLFDSSKRVKAFEEAFGISFNEE
jgi:hypothetical protein